jgi:hypothetical protein
MEYLGDLQANGVPLGLHQTFYDEASEMRTDLLGRLKRHRDRWTWTLVLRPEPNA